MSTCCSRSRSARSRCRSRTRARASIPTEVPDPLAPENLLKAYGRGIFFMRQFMDEVQHSFPPKGGTVVRMLKRVPA